MKRWILPALTLWFGVAAAAEYTIVLPADAIPAERSAAAELQHYLRRIGGIEVPVAAAAAPGQPAIYVGGHTPEELRPDEIILGNSGGDILLTGARPRGALYAVYTYLEEYLDVRFWTATESTVPQRDLTELPKPELRYAPPFYYRETNYRQAARDPALAVKFKLNGTFNEIPPELGGHLVFTGLVHTFDKFMPAARYFADHPEWFSLNNGRRIGGQTDGQLCLTNPEMRQEFLRILRRMLEQDPSIRILSVSQNDNAVYCQCDACAAIDVREGSQSGSLLDFVNFIATELQPDYPELWVETLAYLYTRKPPEHIRPAANVLIRLCSIEADFSHPLDSEANASFRDDLTVWREIAPQLAIWNYVTNFTNYLLPHPNMSAWAADCRFFAANRVKAVFQQADGATEVGPWVALRSWLLAKLLWDPSQNQDELIDTFLAGYYGGAAPFLRRQYDLAEAAVAKSDHPLKCFMHHADGWLTLDELMSARQLQQQALDAVDGDPVLRERVERNGVCWDIALLERNGEESAGQMPLAERRQVFDRLLEVLRQTPPYEYAEGIQLDSLLRQFRYNLGNYGIEKSGSVPEFCRDLPDERWFELLPEEMVLFSPGVWTTREGDAAAAAGQAVRLSCHSPAWMLQCPVPSPWQGKRGRLYAGLRGENLPPGTPALQVGVYDREAKTEQQFPVDGVRIKGDGYELVEIGNFDFTATQFIYFAPVVAPGQPRTIRVDRIICVME